MVDEVVQRAAGAAIVLTNKTPLPDYVIRQLPELRYICVLATGYNVVDVEAARQCGVVVTNVPTYGTASVAQFVFALLLELCHNVKASCRRRARGRMVAVAGLELLEIAADGAFRQDHGDRGLRPDWPRGRPHRRRVRMRVLACDTYQGDAPLYTGFRWATLEEVLRESDVVSLHSPLFPETRGMIHAGTLALMRPSAFLINTSRGPLVVDHDLAEALNAGRLAGAGLDVLSIEPPLANNPLLGARNCLVTPHIAWATREARSRLMEIAVDNVASFLAGTPRNVIG